MFFTRTHEPSHPRPLRIPPCRTATSRHSDFAVSRHDVLKIFKGASLYKLVRDWRDSLLSIDHSQKILQDPLAVRREHRFRVKLYPLHLIFFMSDAHDLPL